MNRRPRSLSGRENIRRCDICGELMVYTPVHGSYTCKNCGNETKDLYGMMKDLLEDEPQLSLAEMSLILGVSVRELRKYVKNGVLENPDSDQL